MEKWRATFCGGAGAVGSLLTSLFGGWSSDLSTLVICMAVDFLTGLIAAALCKSEKTDSGGLSSAVGFQGIAKKVGILLLVLVAHRIDLVLGISYIKTAAVIAFVINEVISIIENAGHIGIPMPEIFKKAIDLLHNKAGEDEFGENDK